MVGAAQVAAILLALASAASAQGLRVEGSCRDGYPHGSYELRDANGMVRAVGAFNRGKRTGSFLFWSAGGARLAQLPYDDDELSGNVAVWYPPVRGAEQRQKLEAAYARGRLSGAKRSWHANGRERTQLRYADGELVEARAFADTGKPLPDADARTLAVRDQAVDARFIHSLAALVREHLPRCQPAGDRLEKG
jgi:hypothetical protein